ncbi:DUF397 domain-containing protein [Streptomyces sp. NPDC055992]|uniref:DUF397 domain-containing protein n=1 Tax=Streptomyces sp. NPDC055992 TaxID=3345673 RepID=UPI0035DE2DE4
MARSWRSTARRAGPRTTATSSRHPEERLRRDPLKPSPWRVPVRDSKRPDGPALLLGAAAWAPFIDAVKAG